MSKVPRFRATLTQRGCDIRGTVELGPDPVFNLEAVALIVERIAKHAGVPFDEVLTDLSSIQRHHESQNSHTG